MSMVQKRLEQQGGRCFLCSEPLEGSDFNRDHLMPLSKGGADLWQNIVLTHTRCNERKADRLPTDQEIDRFVAMTGHRPWMADLISADLTPQPNSFAIEMADDLNIKMADEPNAYKRAVFREGWKAAMQSCTQPQVSLRVRIANLQATLRGITETDSLHLAIIAAQTALVYDQHEET